MNRFSKVLLLTPAIHEGKNVLPFYPLPGLGYIAESLLRRKIDYIVCDMRLSIDGKSVLSLISSEKVDLIGISMMSFHYLDTYHLIQRIKESEPNICIAVGGPHLSTFQAQVLTDCPEIDYGFIQEGEFPFLELIENKAESEIGGLIYRQGNEVVINPKKPYVKDLDSLNYPTYKGFNLKGYLGKQMPIVTSRGCPYDCIYCPIKTTIGKTFRARAPQNIYGEVQYWYNAGYKEFLIQDDNFTLIPERVIEFCELIADSNLDDIIFRLPNGIRADKITLEMLQIMKEVGFRSLAFGVEAGNDNILGNIKKGEKLQDIEQGIELACRFGFDVALFFIIGSPGETWKDLEDSVSLALKYPVKEANFYNLIPFPGTELYEWAQKKGYLLSEPENYLNHISHFVNQPVLATPEMSYEERLRAFEYTGKISKIVKRKGISQSLAKWSILGSLIAYIFTTDWFQKVYFENRKFRDFLDKIKGWLR